MESVLPTKNITINGQTYTIRAITLDKSIEITRLVALSGLVKAPFKINKINIESLQLDVLQRICNEIELLTQQSIDNIRMDIKERARGYRA